MFSGCFSTSGSASQPSWKSTRHTSSACRCSSTDWLRMERRIEPEPALGREIRRHVDVGDQEAVAEHLAFGVEAQHVAHRAARAVAHDQPVAGQRVVAVGCGDPQPHRRVVVRRRRPPCASSASRRRAATRTPHHAFLEVVLLQVDERGAVMPGFRQQVELVRELVAVEHLADVPAHALLRDRLRRNPAGRGSRACASRSRWRASRR